MNKLEPELSVAPAIDLISLDEARAHVRRDDNDDDTILGLLIATVASRLDGFSGVLGRALINQTWIERADGFSAGDVFRLDLMPLVSISSVKYYDADNALQTLSPSAYSAHNRTNYSYVRLANDEAWPATYERDDAVEITYVAGYGSAAADVPAVIRHAAFLTLGNYYENREEVITGTIASRLPDGVMTLLRPYIRPHF